ncbi:Stk1 family PASTA domain-containing Ser/Thr kinase [Jiangella gansuensis]|uniref:Stk1 family PASTA domain-containing Ser/Thr kinase n=1 Tax=Jiangella gansuensis TaxID=281473 RepID=UPI00047D057A|nr:PASTA domain-containing protein [Jiangella gansuensis]
MDISVSDAPVGRLLDGRYRVEALLARGGMATVYKATDTRLDRLVALKVMHAELAADDDFVARFIGEARAVAKLSDPNVVNVFDQGEDDGAVYLAMEYIHGRTLREVLHERGRLGAGLALEVAESVLSALAAAHRAGIVHRDVKPENVLVGNDGRVKVADFGLARALSSSYKTTRGLLGTVSYISPEQALGERATPRSDVYSAGIMLYELLTGRTPHEGPTDFVVVRSHIDDDVPPPSDTVPLPPAVDDIVLTATARNPRDRYADADEFLAAIRAGRARLAGLELPADDDATDQTHLHAESRDSAGVTLDEALAGTVLADQLGRAPSAPPGDDDGDDSPGEWPGDDLAGTVEEPAGAQRGAGHQSRSIAADETAGDDTADHAGDAYRGSTRLIDAAAAAPAAERSQSRGAAHRTRGRSRSRRGLFLFFFVLLLAVVVALAAWWYGSGRWESTPSLLNLSAEQAEVTAEEAGLTVVADGEAYSETVEAGLILSTDPAPGEQILRGGEISYVLSLGPERYEVPELVGLTVDAATEAAAAQSITVRPDEEVHSEDVEAGVIISQSVEPGEQVRRDSEVAVVVSLGPEPIEIPDFTGRSAEDARATLDDLGFTVNSSEQNSDDVDAGLVISQEPASGTGFRGDEINIVVSAGPELIDVPNVIGERVTRAEELLREAGFTVEIIDLFDMPGNDRGARVVRVDPEGSRLPRGTTITLSHF